MPDKDDSEFTVVGKRGKPLQIKPEKPKIEEAIPEQPKSKVDDIYSPDFAAPTAPFDVLFKTRDGTLFWFSLPLLTCYSPYFAAIDWDTLRRPDGLKIRSGCVFLPTTPSDGFALILHTLLLDYTQRRLDLELQVPRTLPFPSHILNDELVEALHQALDIARSLRIDAFTELISNHLLIHAREIISARPFEAFALALTAGSYDVMRKSINYFPTNPRAPIPASVDQLIKELSPGVPKDLWSSLRREWNRVTTGQCC